MLRLRALIAAALLLTAAPMARANDPGSDGLFGRDVRQAIALKGRLWLQGFGALARVDLDTGNRHVEIPNGVLDMARWNGQVWALRRRADIPTHDPAISRYSAYYLRGGAFFELPPLSAKTATGPQRMAMSNAGPRLIGAAGLWTLPKGAAQWSARPIRWPAGETGASFAASAASADGHWIWLSRAGAGPVRVDVARGRAEALGGRPVAALAQDPKRPACVIIAYADAASADRPALARGCGAALEPVKAPVDIEPLVSLGADGEVIWAASKTALWRIEADKAERLPFGTWWTWVELEIAKPAPGVVLVLSDLHAHAGERAPLIAAGP